MPGMPTGTVTFLFTDIEGSTARWEREPGEVEVDLARHDALLRKAIESHGGTVFQTLGHAFCAVFATAPAALAAALAAQAALDSMGAPGRRSFDVRMALHSGSTHERENDYFGPAVNRVARLLSTGHGGQVLISLATRHLVRDELPQGVALRELGLYRLKDLAQPERIFQLVAPQLSLEFPPLRTLDTHSHNLPFHATPFIGRVDDVRNAAAVLRRADVQLLMLTGPGGIGKTRLGLEVATEVFDDFPDGVFFVSLSGVPSSELVVPAIALTVGVKSSDPRLLDALIEHIGASEVLLVLDALEQVVTAAPDIAKLLGACAGVKILATSRVVLRIQGESQINVPPMAFPQGGEAHSRGALLAYDSIRLFIERANAANDRFDWNDESAAAIAEICRSLEGLPLAIELVAARVRLLSPTSLLPRLGERLEIPAGGASAAPARQQTVRQSIAWSYDLLWTSERKLLRHLSPFAGGCTIDAAEAVCNAAGELDLAAGLANLVNTGLLRQQEEPSGQPRFTMPDTVREFVLKQSQVMDDAGDARRRHATFFLQFLQAHVSAGWSSTALAEPWFDDVEVELDNFRAAMSWALSPDGDPDLGLSIAGQLGPFWSGRHCVAEGRGWLEALIASSGVNHSTEAWANALTALGTLVWEQGDHGRARRILEDSLQACRALDWRLGISQPLRILGLLAMERGDVEQARPFLEECLLLARTRGDEDAIAMSLVQLGDALVVSDRAVARAMYAESLAHYRKTESMEIATVLGSLGRMRLLEGDYAEARALCEDALELRLSGTDARRIADARKVSRMLLDVRGTSTPQPRCMSKVSPSTDVSVQNLQSPTRLAGSVSSWSQRGTAHAQSAASWKVSRFERNSRTNSGWLLVSADLHWRPSILTPRGRLHTRLGRSKPRLNERCGHSSYPTAPATNSVLRRFGMPSAMLNSPKSGRSDEGRVCRTRPKRCVKRSPRESAVLRNWPSTKRSALVRWSKNRPPPWWRCRNLRLQSTVTIRQGKLQASWRLSTSRRSGSRRVNFGRPGATASGGRLSADACGTIMHVSHITTDDN